MGLANMKTVVVTGAAGFLGRSIVEQLITHGVKVKAVIRADSSSNKLLWNNHPLVELVEIDLATESAPRLISNMFSTLDPSTTVLIHAAAASSGDDKVHLEQTIEPTKRIFEAMGQNNMRRAILISSLSVYGYSSIPDYAQLDETSPTETYINFRDGYCRAKTEQERVAILAAQSDGIAVSILRPGLLYSAEHFWSPRLGFTKGTIGINIGSYAPLPLISVDDCANAIILAAMRDTFASDIYIPKDISGGESGALEFINIIGDEQPTQREYLTLLRTYSNYKRKNVVTIPWGIAKRVAKLFFLMGTVYPKLISTLPLIMIEPAFQARFKPLRYSNCRLKDRLGWSANSNLISNLKRT